MWQKTSLLYNWKSGHNSVGQVGAKANEVDPGGSKVDPPSDPLSLSLERLLLILLGQPSSRPDGTARQVEGATVGKGGDKDGVHDEEEEGENAGAKHGGHQGGLGDVAGPKGDHEEGEEEDEEARGRLAGWKEKAEDAEKSEQGGGDQDLLDVA